MNLQTLLTQPPTIYHLTEGKKKRNGYLMWHQGGVFINWVCDTCHNRISYPLNSIYNQTYCCQSCQKNHYMTIDASNVYISDK